MALRPDKQSQKFHCRSPPQIEDHKGCSVAFWSPLHPGWGWHHLTWEIAWTLKWICWPFWLLEFRVRSQESFHQAGVSQPVPGDLGSVRVVKVLSSVPRPFLKTSALRSMGACMITISSNRERAASCIVRASVSSSVMLEGCTGHPSAAFLPSQDRTLSSKTDSTFRPTQLDTLALEIFSRTERSWVTFRVHLCPCNPLLRCHRAGMVALGVLLTSSQKERAEAVEPTAQVGTPFDAGSFDSPVLPFYCPVTLCRCSTPVLRESSAWRPSLRKGLDSFPWQVALRGSPLPGRSWFQQWSRPPGLGFRVVLQCQGAPTRHRVQRNLRFCPAWPYPVQGPQRYQIAWRFWICYHSILRSVTPGNTAVAAASECPPPVFEVRPRSEGPLPLFGARPPLGV